jgi:DNA-binding XRE family transcriptional regulator
MAACSHLPKPLSELSATTLTGQDPVQLVCLALENRMSFSTVRNSIVCSFCHLKQFEHGTGRCRRCHRSLGFTYIELDLSADQQHPQIRRREMGRLLRFLRSRYGVTQSELASRTGIHRTYLSRVECGRIIPSLIVLMQIARALGIDKIVARIRIPPASA